MTITDQSQRMQDGDRRTVVLTGATGFIGRRLAALLCSDAGNDVHGLVYDNDSEYEIEGRRAIESFPMRATRGDLVSGAGLEALPKKPALVFHLAASTHTEDRDHRCNDIGSANLMRALAACGPETHVIFTSTMAVYDDRADCSTPMDDSTLPSMPPRSEYGRTKLAAEEILKKRCAEQGFRLSIVRLSTVYGRGIRDNGMFDSIHRMMRANSILPRFDWPGKIALVHVQDVAELLVRLAGMPPQPGRFEIYIPYSDNLTLSEISEHIYRSHGVPYRRMHLPRIFWKTCALVSRSKGWLEPVLPHGIHTRLWQASLVLESQMWCSSRKLHERIPDWRPRHFSDTVHELFGPTAATSPGGRE